MKRTLLALVFLLGLSLGALAAERVIVDMAGWNHPVKAVFAKHQITPLKVVLQKDDTYPLFYVSFPVDLAAETLALFKAVAVETAKANGYWDFEIIDEAKRIRISVKCSRVYRMITLAQFFKNSFLVLEEETPPAKGRLFSGSYSCVTWGPDSPNDASINLHFTCDPRPLNLSLGLDHPNSFRIMVWYKTIGINLFDESHFEGGFDHFGNPRPGFCVEACEHDFDGDNHPELLVAAGNGLTELYVNVFKYKAPAKPSSNSNELLSQLERAWTLVGHFEGQSQVVIEDGQIVLPIGSAGLCSIYRWSGNGFKTVQ